MLDPRFQAAEAQYRTLRAEYDAGALAQAPFEAAVRGLMIEHEGRWWSIGAATGHWFVSQNDAWVQALPPGMDTPPAAAPESAQPPNAAAAQPIPPPSHPVPPPSRPAAAPAPAARRGNPTLLRIGVTLLVIGAGSFLLPFFGMQFQLISLFGGSQQLIGVLAAVIGLVLVIVGQAGGGGQSAAPQQRPAGAAAPGYVAPPRGPNGCLIGCLVTLGVVVALIIAAVVFLGPPTIAYINMIKNQIEQSSQQPTSDLSTTTPTSDLSTTTPPGDDGARFANGLPPPSLPPCPAGYVPPAPALGQPAPQTCDPNLPPAPPSQP